MDDQPHVRATIKATLQLNGFDVTEAGDGKAGLAAFDTTKFDLAIIDIYMPKLDGVKVIKQLRARNPALPIIAISGVALGKSARTTLDFLPDAGLNDVFCLKKPFRSAELLSVVENVLQFAQWPTQPVSA
jgi:DNA-binding response OmpR family regulator